MTRTSGSRLTFGFGCAILLASAASAGTVVYVDDDAPPGGDGTSWDTAFRFLQDGLAFAADPGSGVPEIRVGQGTYLPDRDELNPGGTGDRTATFNLISNVAIRGGYAGFGAGEPDARDIEKYETILSGDLLGDDGSAFENNDENAHHVVFAKNVMGATLDGLTCSGGNANGTGDLNDPADQGGGLRFFESAILMSNCRIERNAGGLGGGAYARRGIYVIEHTSMSHNGAFAGGALFGTQINDGNENLTLRGCVFEQNATSDDGGALHITSVDERIIDCEFHDNTSGGRGGAIRMANGLIQDSSFEGNAAAAGGAVFSLHNGMDVINCEFRFNVATEDGGAIRTGDACTIISSTFTGNSAEQGGALRLLDGALVRNCLFEQNTATRQGGAAVVEAGWDNTFERCSFISNSTTGPSKAFDGGGAVYADYEVIARNCLFAGNHSDFDGGAVSARVKPFTFTNCAFTGNTSVFRGGALLLDGVDASMLAQCTFSNNSTDGTGGGVHLNPDELVRLSSCVFWGNTDESGRGESAQAHHQGGPLEFIHCAVEGWTGGLGGVGVIGDDPLFVDALGRDGVPGTMDDDLRLQPASPCIDSGAGAGLLVCDLDLDNHERNVDDPDVSNIGAGDPTYSDMGAYEFGAEAIADCDVNGRGDACELGDGTGVDCNDNGIIDTCDLDMGVSTDCDINGVPDQCDLASGEAADCNGNGVLDECDISAMTAMDCNENGVPDGCDVELGGGSPDCNNNGVPDECDVAAGLSFDCNENGVPDECDIAHGHSLDCNANGIPDECDTRYEEYVLDDGFPDAGIGATNAGDMIWLNQFVVEPDHQIVVAVDIAWWTPGEGTPTDIAIWRDPDGDGDPSNAELVTLAGPFPAQLWGDPFIHRLEVPATFIGEPGDVFFVGAHINHKPGLFPAAFDNSSPSQMASWYAEGDNLEDLGESDVLGLMDTLGFPGNWLLRAIAVSESDQNDNGIPDECEQSGDLDGDGVVGPTDLAIILGNWGPCPAPFDPCSGDITGDGVVGPADLAIVLGNWS